MEADTTPPELVSLTIPSEIDLSSGPETLVVSGAATDDIAGVAEMVIWLDDSLSYSFRPSSTSYSSYSVLGLFSDADWADGSASEDWSIAPTNPSGTINVTSVRVEDLQGNTRTYDAIDLDALGVNTEIKITGSTPDTTPPELVSLTIPSEIDLSSGPETLVVSGAATDDIAGVAEMVIWLDDSLSYSFRPSSTSYSSYSVLGLFSDADWADGSASEDWSIAPTNPSGTINVTSVRVEDLQPAIFAEPVAGGCLMAGRRA